ncbi:MAG TPA: oligosaccharide flippase family protein [Acidimicrobiales bacterium]|nr:oligosaccharide flippase family protein [Acidimicrobiales bacterium]
MENHDTREGLARPQPVPDASGVTRAISWMAAAQILGQATSFVSVMALGALLPPSAFGTVTAGVVLVWVATLLMGAGTWGSIVSTPGIGARDARGALALNVANGVVLAAAMVVVAEPMIRNFAKGGDPNVVRALSVSLVLYSLSIVPTALLQKRMRFKPYAIAVVAAITISSVTAVGAAVLGAGVWALVLRLVLYHAILTVLIWWTARDLLSGLRRRAGADQPVPAVRRGGWSFFVLSAATLVAFNADYLVVGRLTDTTELGTYALAFTLSFVPLRQFAWQIGGVFLATSAASAATADPERVGRQMVRALRMTAVLLLPVVPPAVAVAPWLPRFLGPEWIGMVVPFQVLFSVGVGHALLNVIGEFLAGSGSVGFRARVSVVWAIGMVVALVLLVPAFGIRGAAAAHALLFVPLAVIYVFRGSRHLGLSGGRVLMHLKPVVVPVAVQGLVTTGLAGALVTGGISSHFAGVLAGGVGLAVVTVMLLRAQPSALKEALSIAGGVLARRPTASTAAS